MNLNQFSKSLLAILTFAGLIVAQVVESPAVRGSSTDRISDEFDLLDANGDKEISKAEFERQKPRAISNAKKLLAEKNGTTALAVSRLYIESDGSEFSVEFAEFDENRDGMISFYAEYFLFPIALKQQFVEFDVDRDRNIAKTEFVDGMRQIALKRPFGYCPVGEEPPGELDLAKWGQQYLLRDGNQDGLLSWQEMRQFEKALPHRLTEGCPFDSSFVSQDTDLDLQISRNEFLAITKRIDDPKFSELKQKVFRLRDSDRDQSLTFKEFALVGENVTRQFVQHDKNGDQVLSFEEIKGSGWVAGQSIERDQAYFSRLDSNHDLQVSWKEFRNYDTRGSAFMAIDHLSIDNAITPDEWKAVEGEYEALKGKPQPIHAMSGYAVRWFPGIFSVVHFADLDANQDDSISWKEFVTFPHTR